jgi:hypothetical protein
MRIWSWRDGSEQERSVEPAQLLTMARAKGPIAAWIAGLIAFLAATNLYVNPTDDRQQYADGYRDSFSYITMAEAAPGLPDSLVPFHHAQRLAIPYTIGLAHDATEVGLHALFLLTVIGFGLGAVLLLVRTLSRIGSPWPHVVVAAAILAMNPWTFRPYLAYAELVDDVGFVCGLAIIVHALVTGRVGLLLVGQVVASAGRQTGLLLLPMIAVALWRAEPWCQIQPARRWLAAVGTTAIATTIYVMTSRLATEFGQTNINVDHFVGLIAWMQSSFSAHQLGAFIVAAAEAPFVPLVVLGVGSLMLRRRPSMLAASLLLGAGCIWAQPILAGPGITGGNIQRLMTLGLLPVVVAMAMLLQVADPLGEKLRQAAPIVATLLALASMHHHYVGEWIPFFETNRLSIALFAVGAVTSAGLLTASIRPKLE